MTQGIHAPHGFISFDSRRLFSQTVLGAGALALSLFGVWMLHPRPVAPKVVKAPAATSAPTVAANPCGALLVDLRFSSRSTTASLSQSVRLEAKVEPAPSTPPAVIPEARSVQPESIATASQFGESPPLPPRRPPEFGMSASYSPPQAPVRQLAQQNRTIALPAAPSENQSFFEKIFGAPESSKPQTSGSKPSGLALAYAAPETGLFGGTRNVTSDPSPRYDRFTAVYDISAHTVYLPNGTKLEAHSGLRERLDDPRYVHERMRGPTPPHVYELAPREQLFHGVQALRLIPLGGGGAIFGRAGLLAHTYMLGPNGDSNGCVSFRNYDAFLQAYKNGEVKRLVVVARLD